jgi:hypothetical protein
MNLPCCIPLLVPSIYAKDPETLPFASTRKQSACIESGTFEIAPFKSLPLTHDIGWAEFMAT